MTASSHAKSSFAMALGDQDQKININILSISKQMTMPEILSICKVHFLENDVISSVRKYYRTLELGRVRVRVKVRVRIRFRARVGGNTFSVKRAFELCSRSEILGTISKCSCRSTEQCGVENVNCEAGGYRHALNEYCEMGSNKSHKVVCKFNLC